MNKAMMPYEIHITVSINEGELNKEFIENFKTVCKNLKVKPIVLDLESSSGNLMAFLKIIIFIINMMYMKNDITNSCGNKRGCEITLLPSDSEVKQIKSKKCVIVKFIKNIEKMAA